MIAKVDVEGFERHVLEGLEKLFAKSKKMSLILEFCQAHLLKAGTDPEKFFHSLMNIGQVFRVDSFHRLSRIVEQPQAVYSNLFITNSSEIANAIQSRTGFIRDVVRSPWS